MVKQKEQSPEQCNMQPFVSEKEKQNIHVCICLFCTKKHKKLINTVGKNRWGGKEDRVKLGWALRLSNLSFSHFFIFKNMIAYIFKIFILI